MKLSKKKGENNRTGARGERYAARWLRFHGYMIIARNARMYSGELDIIASRGKYICFCEVKTRTDGPNIETYGRPARAVNREKQLHIIRATKEYLSAHPSNKQPRLDIIEVYLDPENIRKHRIVHIENAFGDESR